MIKTHLSSKGQLIIPKVLRDLHHWTTGQEFIVENCENGLILHQSKKGQSENVDELLGCANYHGKRKSIEEMEEAIEKGIKERHDSC